jgi:hypothetical protein
VDLKVKHRQLMHQLEELVDDPLAKLMVVIIKRLNGSQYHARINLLFRFFNLRLILFSNPPTMMRGGQSGTTASMHTTLLRAHARWKIDDFNRKASSLPLIFYSDLLCRLQQLTNIILCVLFLNT